MLKGRQMKAYSFKDFRPKFRKSAENCRWSNKNIYAALLAIVLVICIFIVRGNRQIDGINIPYIETGTVFDYSEFQNLPSDVHDELTKITLQRRRMGNAKVTLLSANDILSDEINSLTKERNTRNYLDYLRKPYINRSNDVVIDDDGKPILVYPRRVDIRKIRSSNDSKKLIAASGLGNIYQGDNNRSSGNNTAVDRTKHLSINSSQDDKNNSNLQDINIDNIRPCPVHPPNLREFIIECVLHYLF